MSKGIDSFKGIALTGIWFTRRLKLLGLGFKQGIRFVYCMGF